MQLVSKGDETIKILLVWFQSVTQASMTSASRAKESCTMNTGPDKPNRDASASGKSLQNDSVKATIIALSKLSEISSTALLGERKELSILHNGERYTLRITANQKLILTK
jgi:hemin uptake protein HemP